ncbi:MAG: ornithine cyclodeaminase family protein [Haloarculaceae archaeon]
MVRVLSDEDVAACLSLPALLPVVEEAFLAQGRGEVERPERPHFPVGFPPDGRPRAAGTGLVMPAYLHGEEYYATKLASVHEGNSRRGLPTVNAQVALTDAATGQPVAYMAGRRVTNARTGCIGGLAVRDLRASEPVTLGIVGAGTQARWQARAIAAAVDVEAVRVYAPSTSRQVCAEDLSTEFGIPAEPTPTAEAAVRDADAVVTATPARSPVFDGDALSPGTVVVAIGAYTEAMRELDDRTVERADRVFADVPEEAARTGDCLAAGVEAADIVPLSNVFEGAAGREADGEILVVASVGSAVLDAATAASVYERAGEDVGTDVDLGE